MVLLSAGSPKRRPGFYLQHFTAYPSVLPSRMGQGVYWGVLGFSWLCPRPSNSITAADWVGMKWLENWGAGAARGDSEETGTPLYAWQHWLASKAPSNCTCLGEWLAS